MRNLLQEIQDLSEATRSFSKNRDNLPLGESTADLLALNDRFLDLSEGIFTD